MGGSLFKNTERLSKEEYIKVVKYLQENIEAFKDSKTFMYLDNKESYGDIDLLLSYDNESDKIKNYRLIEDYARKFEFPHYTTHINGCSLCFDLSKIEELNINKKIQVDVEYIKIEANNDKAFQYRRIIGSYSDFFNIIGVLVKKYDLTITYDKLYYDYYFNNRQNRHKIVWTDNIEDVFKILGLDIERYKQGFKDEIEFFDFITNSKIFFTDPYLHINSAYRRRKSKREVFNKFVEEYLPNKMDILPKVRNEAFYNDIINLFSTERIIIDKKLEMQIKYKAIKDILVHTYIEMKYDIDTYEITNACVDYLNTALKIFNIKHPQGLLVNGLRNDYLLTNKIVKFNSAETGRYVFSLMNTSTQELYELGFKILMSLDQRTIDIKLVINSNKHKELIKDIFKYFEHELYIKFNIDLHDKHIQAVSDVVNEQKRKEREEKEKAEEYEKQIQDRIINPTTGE